MHHDNELTVRRPTASSFLTMHVHVWGWAVHAFRFRYPKLVMLVGHIIKPTADGHVKYDFHLNLVKQVAFFAGRLTLFVQAAIREPRWTSPESWLLVMFFFFFLVCMPSSLEVCSHYIRCMQGYDIAIGLGLADCVRETKIRRRSIVNHRHTYTRMHAFIRSWSVLFVRLVVNSGGFWEKSASW